MGFLKSVEKIGKKFVSATTDPKNLINPLASVVHLGEDVYEDYKDSRKKAKAKAEEAERAVLEASNKAFGDDLENKRKAGQKSKVIFAGILGSSGKIGLGGQKSLLGL